MATPCTWWLGATLVFAPPTREPALPIGPPVVGRIEAAGAGSAAVRRVGGREGPRRVKQPQPLLLPPDDSRRILLGLELVGMQVPTLLPGVVRIDPRAVGRSATMVGLGALFRVRVHRLISVDVSARSGTLRFRDQNNVVDHDRLMTEVGILLDVVRTQTFRLGVDGGVGLGLDQLRYNIEGERSRQRWLTGLTRVGLDIELSTRRISFLGAVRLVGAGATPSKSANQGALFEGEDVNAPAPVDPKQLWIVGIFGVAYRF